MRRFIWAQPITTSHKCRRLSILNDNNDDHNEEDTMMYDEETADEEDAWCDEMRRLRFCCLINVVIS